MEPMSNPIHILTKGRFPSHHLKPAINEIAVFPAKKLTCFIAKMFKYFHIQKGLTYRMMTLSCLRIWNFQHFR